MELFSGSHVQCFEDENSSYPVYDVFRALIFENFFI